MESVHEIELIIVKLINEAMTKAVTIEQMVDILEIFTDFQQRTVRVIRESRHTFILFLFRQSIIFLLKKPVIFTVYFFLKSKIFVLN